MKILSIVHNNKAILIKISQFLGYFLLLIGLGYQIQRLYRKLKIDPEIFSKESSIQSSEIPFPAVTFCSPNTVKNEAWNPEYLTLNNITRNDLLGALLQICPNHEMNVEYNRDSNANVVEVLLKASPNFADNVYQCGLNKYTFGYQDCEKLFVRSVTDRGICNTFNMLGYDELFNGKISSDFDTFERTKIAKNWDPDQILDEARHEDDKNSQKWNLQDGYLVEDDFVQPARALKLQTLLFGVFNQNNDSFCEFCDKSYEIILHMPNELPQVSYDTIDIELGKEKTFLISAEVIHNEESLRSFSPEKRGCYFEGKKQLKVFKSYTKANCEYECMAEFVNATCGCVKFSMPRTKDMKVCGFDEYSCFNIITSIFPRSYYENHKNKKIYPHYPCGCLPSCTEVNYKVVRSDKSKKSEFSSETHKFAVATVIFADSQIKMTSNYVTYEMENFVFDIGGLIGLFLGSSILSVLHLIWNLCKTILNHVRKIKNILRSDENVSSSQSISNQSEVVSVVSNDQEMNVEEMNVEELNVQSLE